MALVGIWSLRNVAFHFSKEYHPDFQHNLEQDDSNSCSFHIISHNNLEKEYALCNPQEFQVQKVNLKYTTKLETWRMWKLNVSIIEKWTEQLYIISRKLSIHTLHKGSKSFWVFSFYYFYHFFIMQGRKK